jgi:hypothetical protein
MLWSLLMFDGFLRKHQGAAPVSAGAMPELVTTASSGAGA